MRLFVSVAAFSLALTGATFAQPTYQPAAKPSVEAGAGKSDKKADGVVCHKEMVTGSQFPVKVCTTPDERQAQRRMAQRAQETMQGPSPVIPN